MVEKTIVKLNLAISEKEKDLARLDRWLPFFRLFYTKEEHVNLKRLVFYLLAFVVFFYAFKVVATGGALLLVYNFVVFLAAAYIFALYHVSHKHDVLKKEVADLQKEKLEWVKVLDSRKRGVRK